MKKIISIILALTLCIGACFAFASCGAKGKTLDQVLEAGKLVIATSPDFPPFENLEDGEVVGIEIDIMTRVCEELGVELVIETMDFDSVLIGIQAGKYDCAVSGITRDAKREKNMLFTTPYYNAAQCIVVKSGSDIATAADLEGKTVSVQTGTTAATHCAAEEIANMQFKSNGDAKNALITGKVDAWVVDNCTAAQMVESGDGLIILEEYLTEEPYAFAFTFGSETLVEAIDAIVKNMIDGGEMEQIFAAYNEAYVAP